MPNKIASLSGTSVGYMRVIELTPKRTKQGLVIWSCVCTRCGSTVFLSSSNARRTQSCKPCADELASAKNKQHGHAGKAKSPTYRAWSSMIDRCNNEKHPAYANYGGRGVTVSQSWELFENFLFDMGVRPDGLSLDRIDNAMGYSKENCRWATRVTQQRNKRTNVLVTALGRTQPLVAWAEETGIPAQTIAYRVRHGWEPDKAVTTPTIKSR
jgi:hypothetical protein